MYTAELSNPGGVIDSCSSDTPEGLCKAVVLMLEQLGEMHDGDTIVVKETD